MDNRIGQEPVNLLCLMVQSTSGLFTYLPNIKLSAKLEWTTPRARPGDHPGWPLSSVGSSQRLAQVPGSYKLVNNSALINKLPNEDINAHIVSFTMYSGLFFP